MKGKKGNGTRRTGLPVWSWGVGIAVIVLIIGLVIYQSQKPGGTSLPAEINITQAAEKRSQGAFILDVRQPEEWQQFHIPGATLIPLGDLPNRLNEVPKDKEVVVVCRSGNRSAQGRDILLQAGFSKVTSMAGGVTQWQSQGLETATGQ